MAGPVIEGENYRISVLTESLVRLEYSEDGVFEDGQTQVVQNRDFGPVACEVIETEEVLDLHTEHLHLHFEKGTFCPRIGFLSNSRVSMQSMGAGGIMEISRRP